MASTGADGGGEGGFGDGGSLFEGMVLVDASDLLAPSSSSISPLPLPPSIDPSSTRALDENLFSDLTILSQPSLDQPKTPVLPSRLAPRKKKKPIRIGYARDAAALQSPSFSRSISDLESGVAAFEADSGNSLDPVAQIHEIVAGGRNSLDSAAQIHEIIADGRSSLDSAVEIQEIVADGRISLDSAVEIQEIDVDSRDFPDSAVETREIVVGSPNSSETEGKEEEQRQRSSKDDGVESMEKNLGEIKAQISTKIGEIKKAVELLSEERKALRKKRRNAADSANSAAVKHRELERELEEACEVEDFEKAESVSESLAAAEKDRDDQLRLLRRTEEDCDAVDQKLQEILDLQISTEEEFIALLEKFSEDAGERADQITKKASEIHSKEMEEWEISMETLESRRLETEVESNVVEEARSGLAGYIDGMTEADQKEKEALTEQGILLDRELEELLEQVRQKQAQITENKLKIQKVEERISKAVSEFHESQSSIIAKSEDFLRVLSEIALENEVLCRKKEEMDESLGLAEKKSLRLKELAQISVEEAKAHRVLVELRRSMSSDVLKVREDKGRLANIEQEKTEEIVKLRQQISVARSSLQELSSTRAKIKEETTLLTQRIGFIDKRVPELEAEKKAAAAARNFREAGRVAAEAKALSSEKEAVQLEVNKKVNDLETVEDEIRSVARKVEEGEELALLKEKEAALAAWERLCLVAATAMAEQAAAAAAGDSDEAATLLSEAKAANSKAREFQERYGFSLESLEKASRCLLSIPMIINLSKSDASAEKNDRV
ncbi:neurofilament light protein [Wolffia australiana]